MPEPGATRTPIGSASSIASGEGDLRSCWQHDLGSARRLAAMKSRESIIAAVSVR